MRALLATLFVSRGTIMLTAGDEFGRTQNGNNNAYAQDNEVTWLDWAGRDRELEDYAAMLAALRARFPALSRPNFLTGEPGADGIADVEWLAETGHPLTPQEWQSPSRRVLAMVLKAVDSETGLPCRLAVLLNGGGSAVEFRLPDGVRVLRFEWLLPHEGLQRDDNLVTVPARTVAVLRIDPT